MRVKKSRQWHWNLLRGKVKDFITWVVKQKHFFSSDICQRKEGRKKKTTKHKGSKPRIDGVRYGYALCYGYCLLSRHGSIILQLCHTRQLLCQLWFKVLFGNTPHVVSFLMLCSSSATVSNLVTTLMYSKRYWAKHWPDNKMIAWMAVGVLTS